MKRCKICKKETDMPFHTCSGKQINQKNMNHKEIAVNDLSFNPEVPVFGILKNQSRPDFQESGVIQFKTYFGLDACLNGKARHWHNRRDAGWEWYFIPCEAKLTIQEPDKIQKGQTISQSFN